MRFESIKKGIAIVFESESQQIADEYLIRKNGSLDDTPQTEKDAAAAWVSGDRNYYDLLKI